METKFVNFFKFLEDKEGQRTPLRIKLLNPKQFELTPEDLKVRGNLYLNNTPITSLPKDLKVGGNLSLSYTKITSLPNGLKVGGNLFLYDTPLSSKTEAEIRRMAPNIKGEIIGLKRSL